MLRRETLKLFAGCLLPIRDSERRYTPAVPQWNRPLEAFQILANLYYVGASGVSAFLFPTSEGLILLDTGFRETVPLIEAGLKKYGHRLEDIRLILTSHAHYDHTGGVAEVKRRSGARLLVNPIEAPAFRGGGLGDFAFGDKLPFPPVEPDGALSEGEPVGLAGTSLTPHFTPGHTKGCTSWTITLREAGRDYRVVIAGSLSAPGYRLAGNREYPEIAADFESSFARLAALPCDVFLSLHSWDFDLPRKLEARRRGAPGNPFVDPGECGRYVSRMRALFRKQYEEQRAAAALTEIQVRLQRHGSLR